MEFQFGTEYLPPVILWGLSADDERRLTDDREPFAARVNILRATILRDLHSYSPAELHEVVEWLVSFAFTNAPVVDAVGTRVGEIDRRERRASVQRLHASHKWARGARDESLTIFRQIEALKRRHGCTLSEAIRRYCCTDPTWPDTAAKQEQMIDRISRRYHREKKRTPKKK